MLSNTESSAVLSSLNRGVAVGAGLGVIVGFGVGVTIGVVVIVDVGCGVLTSAIFVLGAQEAEQRVTMTTVAINTA